MVGEGIKGNPSRKGSILDVELIRSRSYTHKEITDKVNRLFKNYGNGEVALLSCIMTKKSPLPCLINQICKGDEANWYVLGDSKHFEELEDVIKGKRIASTTSSKDSKETPSFLPDWTAFLK